MSKRRCGVGVAVLNDLLYAVGGKYSFLHATYQLHTINKIITFQVMMDKAIWTVLNGTTHKQINGHVM